MANGGVFTAYNKILPGAYINFVSKARAISSVGERGIIAIALKHDFGEVGKIITINGETLEKDSLKILGYNYQDPKLRPFRELLKHAREIKFYRLDEGNKATATVGSLTITAKFPGTRSNQIKIIIENDVDTNKKIVKTILDNDNEVDEQLVSSIEELKSNDYVIFSGTGELTENAGTNLTGGTIGNVNGAEYAKFLGLIESENFNTICYEGEDDETKALFESFTKRLRDNEGIKITTLLIDYNKADYEGIISLDKSVKDLIYWTAGAIAGAEINESLTNIKYDGEILLDISLRNKELEDKIKTGLFTFYGEKDEIRVLKDINTFRSFNTEKNSDFSNNQIIRIIDNVGNDVAKVFNERYLGKEINDTFGRDLFKAELITYFDNLEAIRALTNFDSEYLTIEKGIEKGDVIVNVLIEPVSAMDKLYMKCVIA